MNKYLVALLTLASLCFAVQYSLRIRSLGTDFAYLIPDYETDLYNDPSLMGEKLNGISYEPGLSTPLTMRVLTKRFGWFGNYWAKYKDNKSNLSWYPNTTSISANDLWLLDLRGKFWKFLTDDVWNLYNDGSYNETRYFSQPNDYDTTRTMKYLIGATGPHSMGTNFKLISKVCGGFYEYYRNRSDYGDVDQQLWIYTGRVGIYYRKASTDNFTSLYLMAGGPVTTEDIDNLPYPVFSHLSDDEIQQTFFAKTLVTQLGWAKGIAVNDNGFVAIGLRDVLLYQRTNTADTSFTFPNKELCGLRNTLAFPIALEYQVNNVALRIGTRFYYTFKGDREWNSDSTLVRYNEHNLGFGYTWGISWYLNDNFAIDLYNADDLSSKNNWAIYLRRTW